MEYVRSGPDNLFKKDDPLYPCSFLEKEFGYTYSQACGRNQPALLMSRFNMGFDGVVSVCLSSDSNPFKDSCINALGFSLASSGQSDKIISGCQKFGTEKYISNCLKSAAGELVFQDVPGWREKSQVVCNANLDSRDECLGNVDRIIKEYSRQAK